MLHLFSTGIILYDPILLNRSNQLLRHLIIQDSYTGGDFNLLGLVSGTKDVVNHLIFLAGQTYCLNSSKLKKSEDFILSSSIFTIRGMVVLPINVALLLCNSSQPFTYLKLQNLNNCGYFILSIIFFTTRGEVV